ncbi:MAG: phytanoyl-CoA dioxygenase family protein [Microthrixaceae bacterium]|nr:phytanoyl-CoA dioxygenase family protein [Microthrixaceae bacterium]
MGSPRRADRDVDATRRRAAFERDGLVVVPGLIEPELVERLRADLEYRWTRRPVIGGRIQDLWVRSPTVRRLAAHPTVLAALADLYGRRAIPFQTLNFRVGTEQPLHADSIHFDTVPTGWMCGVWVALEDVGDEQGPLSWVPRSQHLEGPDAEQFGGGAGRFDDVAYEAAVAHAAAEAGLETEHVHANAGDCVVWSAGVFHGGATVNDPDRTRWSQVTHYVFEGLPAVTPQRSRPSLGRWWLRDPLVNVATLGVEREVDTELGAVAPLRLPGGLVRFPNPGTGEPPTSRRVYSAVVGAGRRIRSLPRRVRAGCAREARPPTVGSGAGALR